MTIERDELAIRFTYHAPTGNQPDRYEKIRAMAFAFAEELVELTPQSREQSLALTHLEETVMWANASIARREVAVPAEEPEDLEPEDG